MTGETEREGNGAREQRLLVHFSKCGGGSETPRAKTERVIVSAKSSNDLLRNGTVTNWKLFRTARGKRVHCLRVTNGSRISYLYFVYMFVETFSCMCRRIELDIKE